MKMEKETQDVLQQFIDKLDSKNPMERAEAAALFTEAIQEPLRETLLTGDIVSSIFTTDPYEPGHSPKYELDLLTPSQEDEYYAYVIPDEGRIPERRIAGDYLMVPTYKVGNAIDCQLDLIRNSRWNVVARMMEILEGGFRKKMNDDGFQTILAAAVDRNLLVNDASASQGQFTPQLITLMANFMRRNGGGNIATNNRSRLTDLYVSPEAHIDIRSWTLQEVSDQVRTNIYYSLENGTDLINIFGVRIHATDEFGVGQEYQTYVEDTLGVGTVLTTLSDEEIVVGLDLQREDSFVRPLIEDLEIYEDNTVHRRRLFSLYGWLEHGFAVLDSRRALLGSL